MCRVGCPGRVCCGWDSHMTIAWWLLAGLLFSRFRGKCPGVPEPVSDQRSSRRRVFEGIAVRHKRRCSSAGGGVCSCSASYQAQVWSARDRKPIRRTFGSLAEARAWRQESQVAVRRLAQSDRARRMSAHATGIELPEAVPAGVSA